MLARPQRSRGDCRILVRRSYPSFRATSISRSPWPLPRSRCPSARTRERQEAPRERERQQENNRGRRVPIDQLPSACESTRCATVGHFLSRYPSLLDAFNIAIIPSRTASGRASQRSAISATSGDFSAKSAKQDAKTAASVFGSASDDIEELILASIDRVSSARFSRPVQSAALPPLRRTLILGPDGPLGYSKNRPVSFQANLAPSSRASQEGDRQDGLLVHGDLTGEAWMPCRSLKLADYCMALSRVYRRKRTTARHDEERLDS